MQNVGGVTLSPPRKLGGNLRTLSKAEINRMRLGVNDCELQRSTDSNRRA